MLPFYLAVVSRCRDSDSLVFDPEIQQGLLEERLIRGLRYQKRVGKFCSVIRLNSYNREWCVPDQLE